MISSDGRLEFCAYVFIISDFIWFNTIKVQRVLV